MQEESLLGEVQRNLSVSGKLTSLLEVSSWERKGGALTPKSQAVSSGPGSESLQKWCLLQAVPAETQQRVQELTELQMHRQQTYLDVIVKDFAPPRDAVEFAEDGSLFGARADTLFDMLISGCGAQSNPDFESAFMYGFRAWITPVSLLQRLIEAFCTTPAGTRPKEKPKRQKDGTDLFLAEYKSASRMSIHLARLRVLRLLNIWIEFHEYDISEKRFSSLMHSFLETASIAGYDEEVG